MDRAIGARGMKQVCLIPNPVRGDGSRVRAYRRKEARSPPAPRPREKGRYKKKNEAATRLSHTKSREGSESEQPNT